LEAAFRLFAACLFNGRGVYAGQQTVEKEDGGLSARNGHDDRASDVEQNSANAASNARTILFT
jgi:hypothetical protein